MGISFVAGQMLTANLWRGTANLGFQTNLLYLDVVNGRIGVNTSTPSTAFVVNGNAVANNITTTSVTSTGVLTLTSSSAGNITLTADTTGLVTISGNYGVVIPSGDTTQRPGYPTYSTTPLGTLRLNTALSQLEIWNGVAWLAGGSGGSGNVTIRDQQFSGDGANVTFPLTYGNGQATQSSILVSINGTAQLPTVAYTVNTSANTITFSEVPQTTDVVDIRYLAAAVPPGALYNTSGNAAIHVTDTPNVVFTVNSANVATITTAGTLDISTGRSIKLPAYTVAQATNIATPTTGEVIYVSNGDTGNPCLAVYSGGAWKRISFGANIST